MIFALLLSSHLALAGNGNVVSNGGSIVRCPSDLGRGDIFSGPENLAILDIFESAVHGTTYNALKSFRNQPWEEAFPRAARFFLQKNDPYHLDFILRTFANRKLWLSFTDEPLRSHQSISWNAYLRDCTLEQAAVLYSNDGTGRNDRRSLKISRSIWAKLKTDQKIALLMHELLQKPYLTHYDYCAKNHIQRAIGFILSDIALRTSHDAWLIQGTVTCIPEVQAGT